MRLSLLVPLVGETGLAQIEFPLDPAPRLVFQMAVAVEIVDQLALGFDQLKLYLVVDFGVFAARFVAVVLEFEMQKSGALGGAERCCDFFRQRLLGCQLIEPFNRGLYRPPPRLALLGAAVAQFAAPRVGQAENAYDPRQQQALADKSHENDGEGQEEDEIAVGKRLTGAAS